MAQKNWPNTARPDDQESGQTVTGYLHNVTPVKRSSKNNLYFNAFLQCQDVTRRIVSFDADKIDMMSKAAKATSPVKLVNVSIVPSKSSDETDIQMNKRSRLQMLTDPPFKKRKLETPGASELEKKVDDVVHPLEMVTVQVKVLKALTEPTEQNVYGKEVLKQIFLVADNTGSIPLNAWDNHTDKQSINSSFKISRCSTRMYETLYLTTTPQ